MNAASTALVHQLRPRILERRSRLEAAARSLPADYINDLLAEIDAALQKIDTGSYGLCETCHDAIEPDRLECNPLVRFCLDHLTADELKAHQQDLDLAMQIQARLLPGTEIKTTEWETHYRYLPAGAVGGDYCEIIPCAATSSVFFAVGDVTGKGVAASLLMTHLSAIFRSLVSLDLPLTDTVARANHLFCDSTPATHYATLVAGRASEDGVDVCNAGHCRPFVLRHDRIDRLEAAGLPLGLFCEAQYDGTRVRLAAGESLVLYSDGITEAQNPDGILYDEERFVGSLQCHANNAPKSMADRILRDVARFRGGSGQQDDMTLLILRRHC